MTVLFIALLGQEQYTTWYKLLCKLEGITDQWVSQARKCLLLIQSTSGYANILVSSSPLILTLGKCLLFGLSQVFHIQNVYSSENTGKSPVFERLVSRFGTKCTYVSIGDSVEDEEASKKVKYFLLINRFLRIYFVLFLAQLPVLARNFSKRSGGSREGSSAPTPLVPFRTGMF